MRTSQQYLGASMDLLRTLAENTDGRAIVNRNDLGTAMKQIIRDASAYYLVGYTTQAPSDGKFHEIKVRVKRPGVQVRSRKGFWAYSADELKRAVACPSRPACRGDQGAGRDCPADQPALHPHLDRQRQRRRRPHEGDAAVGAAAAHARRDARRAASCHGAGDLAAGDIIYRGRVPTELAVLGNGGLVSFNAPPGKLDVRLTIEGDGTGTLDVEDRDLTVPDLSAPEIILTTPKVWVARTARDSRCSPRTRRPRRL